MIGLHGVELSVTVRGALGGRGMRELVAARRDPTDDAELRGRLIVIVNHPDHEWAVDAGIRYDAYPHPVRSWPGLITWSQVWNMVAPCITADRVAELDAAWAGWLASGRIHGIDQRLHLAVCALLTPPPPVEPPRQLSLFDDLVGAR